MEKIYSTATAAAVLGLTDRMVREHCQSGRLGRQINGRGPWLITEDELREFLRNRRPVGRPKKTA